MKRVNLLLGLWSVVVFLFLYVPIAVLVIWSFNSEKVGSRWSGFTLDWYRAFWASCVLQLKDWTGGAGGEWAQAFLNNLASDRAGRRVVATIPDYVTALFNSLFVGVIATTASVALGTLSAWLTFKYKYPLRNALNTLVAVPMIVPEIIMGVSLLSFFSVVFAGLRSMGIDAELGFTTVIIGHITFAFPFVMVTVQARLAGIDPALEEAAMDLGATPQQAFRMVIVPYLLPAIISGALMAFTLSLDDFVVTFFVNSKDAETLPIRIYGSYKGPPPMLHVVSTIMIGMTVLTVLLAEGLKRVNR
jgi:spermidine/putrescine transport system permease protein